MLALLHNPLDNLLLVNDWLLHDDPLLHRADDFLVDSRLVTDHLHDFSTLL